MLKILTRLRNYLISGLLFWIPLILTVIVIKFFLEFINSLVPQEYLPEAIFNLNTSIPGSGIILLFIIILITGVLVTNILGRRLVALWEKLLNRIPGFRNIYNILKKVSDTVLNTSSQSFKKAFLIQYPSQVVLNLMKRLNVSLEIRRKCFYLLFACICGRMRRGCKDVK